MFAPDAHMPRINKGMVYLGACLIAGFRLARERQVNPRIVPTSKAVEKRVVLAGRHPNCNGHAGALVQQALLVMLFLWAHSSSWRCAICQTLISNIGFLS